MSIRRLAWLAARRLNLRHLALLKCTDDGSPQGDNLFLPVCMKVSEPLPRAEISQPDTGLGARLA
jgi:hypothetical protein